MLIKTLPNKDRLELVEVRSSGVVAAGKSVPFPMPSDSTVLPLSPDKARLARAGLVQTMTVFGDSLIDVGIQDNDKVVVQQLTSRKAIDSHAVYVVLLPNGETVAKRLVFRKGMLTLKSCNERIPDMHFDAENVTIQGVVIGLYRTPDKRGSFLSK